MLVAAASPSPSPLRYVDTACEGVCDSVSGWTGHRWLGQLLHRLVARAAEGTVPGVLAKASRASIFE